MDLKGYGKKRGINIISPSFKRKIFSNVVLFLVLFWFIYAVAFPLTSNALRGKSVQGRGDSIENENKDGKAIIRFHVKAHSDRPRDQAVKNDVAAEVWHRHKKSWGDINSRENLRRELMDSKSEIKEQVETILEKKEKSYGVDVTLEKRYFPARIYAGDLYPAGKYDALILSLGKGEGENWWCVLFPPLCYLPAFSYSEGNADNNSLDDSNDGELAGNTEKKEADLYQQGSESKEDDNKKDKEKWALRLWLQKLFSH